MADHAIPLTQRQTTKLSELREALAQAEAEAQRAQAKLAAAQGIFQGAVSAVLWGSEIPEGAVDVQLDRKRLVVTLPDQGGA